MKREETTLYVIQDEQGRYFWMSGIFLAYTDKGFDVDLKKAHIFQTRAEAEKISALQGEVCYVREVELRIKDLCRTNK